MTFDLFLKKKRSETKYFKFNPTSTTKERGWVIFTKNLILIQRKHEFILLMWKMYINLSSTKKIFMSNTRYTSSLIAELSEAYHLLGTQVGQMQCLKHIQYTKEKYWNFLPSGFKFSLCTSWDKRTVAQIISLQHLYNHNVEIKLI